MKETGEATFDADITGSKLYQIRARKALPILVRQAKAEQPIFYSDLAIELEIPNPRNLNYILGAIGNSLKKLSELWKTEIPLINVLVINKNNFLPGEGINWFIKDREQFEKSSIKEKRRRVNIYLSEVYNYKNWNDVLKALNLEPINEKLSIPTTSPQKYSKKGESPEHENLKKYISNNPKIIGIEQNCNNVIIEHTFPSQDAIDVLFKLNKKWVGVEVKARNSDIDDIFRGLFQCIKYKALIEAEQMVAQFTPNSEVILVTENEFPKSLIGIKNILGINIMDKIKIK